MARNQISSIAFGQVNSVVRVLPGASVTVTSSSGAPVTLYASEDGTETVSNPFSCDSQGRYAFFVPAGESSYTITVILGPVSYSWEFYPPDNTAAAGLIYEDTWAGLLGRSANLDGAAAEVTDDTGTHLDATATGYDGGEVANLGRYRWNEAWGRWERLADLTPALYGQPYESRTAAEAASIPATVTAIDVLTSSGAVLSYRRDTDGTALTTGDGSNWSPAGGVYPDHWAENTTQGVTDMAAAILAAAAYVADLGSGDVLFMGADYGVSSSTAGADEGAAITLTSDHSGVTFVGVKGATSIKPASNRIECFIQNGADNIGFSGISFDNSANGVLQNQVKTGSKSPGTGVAGLGNAANCAIRQYTGDGLSVRDCEFREFGISINYIGDYTDNNVSSGLMESRNNTYIGCGQGDLIDAPEQYIQDGCKEYDGVDLTNFDTSVDPGHMVYVTDRSGAEPDSVIVTNFYSTGRDSSGVKIRKGLNVVVSSGVIYNNGRGIELSSIAGCGVVDGCSVTLGGNSATGNNSCIEVTGCSNIVVGSDNVLNVNGENAWGLRLRGDPGDSHNNKVNSLTIVDDCTGSSSKSAILLADQTGVTVNMPKFVHTGAGSKASMFNLTGATTAHIIKPEYRQTGGSAAATIFDLDDTSSLTVDVDPALLDVAWSISGAATIAAGASILAMSGGVENGSNADGYYEKHPDGRLTCYHTITTSAAGTVQWDFPYTGGFSNADYSLSFAGMNGGAVRIATFSGADPTSVDVSGWNGSASRVANDFRVMASGRWQDPS